MRLKIESDKVRLYHCLFYHLNRNNTAATTKRLSFETYGENIVSAAVCEKWFKRFRNGDYDFNKPRSDRSNEIENWKHCSTKTQPLKELAEQLEVDESTVSFESNGNEKKGKWFSHKFSAIDCESDYHLSFIVYQTQKKFLVANSYE